MKHAILMTVYKDAKLINRLIASYPEEFMIYIHIDKKTALEETDICSRKNVKVFKEYRVNWGGLNHVRAYIFLLKKAIKDDCDYYHWVTGQDAPVSTSTFDDRIKEGYSYLEYFKIPNKEWCKGAFYEGGLLRYQIFGLYDLLNAKNAKQYRWIQKLEYWQKGHNFVRPFRDYSKLYGGSGYCSLYKTDALVLLREYPKWEHFYKHTFCAEESLIQTIMLNSERKEFIVNDNLRYIDWNDPMPPKILTNNDYDKVAESGCLFCRKVDRIQSDVLLSKLESLI